MRKLLLIAAALFCMHSCVIGAEEQTATNDYDSQLLQPGAEAPDFTIVNAAHPEGMALSSLRGRYVLLEFWASWCPDCRRITQDMVGLYNEYAPRGVEFIGVSFDTDSAAWQRYVQANGMEWTQYSELKKWKAGTTLDGPYRVNWIPTLYLIDPEGRIAAGSISIDKIKEALAGLTATPGEAGDTPAAQTATTEDGQ